MNGTQTMQCTQQVVLDSSPAPIFPCDGDSPPPPLPWNLAESVLVHVALRLRVLDPSIDGSITSTLAPTECPATAPIFVGRGWSRTLLHLFYQHTFCPPRQNRRFFTYGSAAAANRIDRLAFLQTVYGGIRPWHPSPAVAAVLSPRQVQAAVAGAFSNGHLQALDWLVTVHGRQWVLSMINTPTSPTCPLIVATHEGKLDALKWWFRVAREVGVSGPRSGTSPPWHASFEVIEAALCVTASVPMDCVRWWIQDYLPHHPDDSPESEAAQLMFNFLQHCIEANRPSRIAWWIDQDRPLLDRALEIDTTPDYLTIHEQYLLDLLLTTQFLSPLDNNTDACSLTYVINSPAFRPEMKRALAVALVQRANTHARALAWWIQHSPTPFVLPDNTIDQLAATAHSEIDVFDALDTLARCGVPLNESHVAMDLASERGMDLVCEWWATHRGADVTYTHRALEQAVARGMALAVEFWLVSALPLKWRGNILTWAAKYWIPEWKDEVRRLWREYGKELQGSEPQESVSPGAMEAGEHGQG